MTDQQSEQVDPGELAEEDRRTEQQAEDYAKSKQYGQTGDAIDPGMGNVGGAGASGGMQPDIAQQSAATPGNSSDLPSR